MVVTIGKEVFDFLQWKKVGHSFYVRRSDGELRGVALVGSGLPLRAAWFRCEFGDGTTIGFNAYKLLPLSLSEISQLQNVLQESRENKLAEKAGKLTVATELSAKRSAAGRNRAMITDEGDREKIKAAALLGDSTIDSPNEKAALIFSRSPSSVIMARFRPAADRFALNSVATVSLPAFSASLFSRDPWSTFWS